MNLGANISYLRKQKQLTQEQLAEKMNVSRQTVSRWEAESGLKEAYPDAKRIGWDFPFVSQEQQNRFGMRGYAAAYVLPEHFSTEYSGVRYSENAEADYAVITITDPFVNAFERIPNAYKILMEYLRENGMKEKHQTGCISCFEHVYSTCMDVYLQVEGAATIDAYLDLKQE